MLCWLSSESLEKTSTMSIYDYSKASVNQNQYKNPSQKKSKLFLLQCYNGNSQKQLWKYIIQRIILHIMQTEPVQGRHQLPTHPKKSILFANNNLNYIQLGELQKEVAQLQQQNRKKYDKIAEHRPDFNYQLYRIAEFQASSRSFGKQLLLRQLDRLFEEKNYLDRQLSLIKFEKEEQKDQKEKMVSQQTHHFELLKNIWKKEGNRKYEGSIEHVEELNLMVAQIKSNITSLLKFEANQNKEFQQTYLNTFQALHERDCKKCGELKTKNEALNEKLQTLQEKLTKLTEQKVSYSQQVAKRDQKLKKLTQTQLRQQTQLKDKLIRLEQELLKKDQSIKQLKKQIAEYQVNKVINEKQGFQVIFKGLAFDFNKLQRKISIPAIEVFSFFTKQLSQDLKSIQNDLIRFTAKGKSESSEGSSSSCKQVFNEESLPSIIVNKIAENVQVMTEKLTLQGSQKRKSGQKEEMKVKLQQLQVGHKRYVRTGSKRGNKQSSNLQNDQNQGLTSRSNKGGCPNLSPFLE